MRDELASQLLAKILAWETEEFAEHGGQLQVLARQKYDEYEGYRPGEQFLESLAGWLWQFEPTDRPLLLEFVLRRLVFISRAEMDHAIATVYPHIVRPTLLAKVAQELDHEPHLVRQLADSREFLDVHRKTLVVGLADGARLDRLRRSSSFSHEQFAMGPALAEENLMSMCNKLAEASRELALLGDPLFRQVILIDDFSGSGFTLLRQENDEWKGKLWKVREHLEGFRGRALSDDYEVLVVLYVLSEQAKGILEGRLAEVGLDWKVRAAQILGTDLRIQDPRLVGLCTQFFDPVLNDEHLRKGQGDPALGFDEVALPLVLHHNTPNNSVSLLWADSRDLDGSLERRALFPRRQRHAEERP